MAGINPTRAQIQTSWSAIARILNQWRLFGNVTASTNFLTLLDTASQNFRGDYSDELGAALQTLRSNLAAGLSPGSIQLVLRPWLKQFAKSVVGRTDVESASDAELWEEVWLYLHNNAIYVDSRRMTFGSASQTVGTGSVQIVRLTKDDYNYDIEAGYGDVKRLRCIVDQNTGTAQGNEIWQIMGQAKARDELERSGSGIEGTLNGRTIDDSLLNNAGFRSFGGTAGSDAPTSLNGWTATDLTGTALTYNSTNFGIDSTNYFRTAPSDGTPVSFQMKVSSRITQKLTVRGTDLNVNRPHVLAVIWNRTIGSASGTLNLRMGGLTTTVAVAAQSGWQVTTVPNPIGQGAWYRNFYQNDMQIQVEFIRTGGTMALGEILFLEGQFHDGLWYWMLPSSATWAAPKYKDEFTITDMESASGGVNQRFNARAAFAGGQIIHSGYFPHSNGSSLGWADA